MLLENGIGMTAMLHVALQVLRRFTESTRHVNR